MSNCLSSNVAAIEEILRKEKDKHNDTDKKEFGKNKIKFDNDVTWSIEFRLCIHA